ncbi:MAG: hypothetical protein ABI681_08625 [Gemmatimonadales bacterium]
MRHVTLTTLAIAVVAVAACEQQAADRSPTAPDAGLSFGKSTGGPCDAETARLIATQQADLWRKPELGAAKALFAPVVSNCAANSPVAKSRMLDYIQWTIDNRGAILAQRSGATAGAALLAHWNTVFPFVGYIGQDQPLTVPESIFTSDGAAGVVDGNAQRELTATNAAVTIYAQDAAGDQRDHLIVIYPIAANCLAGTNLHQSGPCFQFSSFPHVDPGFSPKFKAGICQPVHEGEAISLNVPALGHLTGNLTKITENGGAYPTFCSHVASAVPDGSWGGGLLAVTKRLAWVARNAFSVEPLYAVHGGLGGIGERMSPFRAVGLKVFEADFQNDAVESAPANPGVGIWTQFATPPGTILVQALLGQHASKLVVLSQAGGNCANCGGLLLEGHLDSAGVAATTGVYDAEWTSLQDGPTMKAAPFVLRDNEGREIARVTYSVTSSTNIITYNGGNTVLANWVRHVPQRFRIRVNLDTKKTTLWIDDVVKVADASFVANATTFSAIAADFRGIDSGTMGWDDIKVQRLPDN